jgi:methionyl-tRNA formyltransferase
VSQAARHRVLLLGRGPTAFSALSSLAAEFQLVGIVRPVQPEAEGADAVIDHADRLGIPVFTDASIENVERLIEEFRPECTVVSSYDRILPSRILERSRFVNVHYAPLPAYRGRANVNWAIINREAETGITIHTMATMLDAGQILYQTTVAIGNDETVADLYARLNEIQRQVLAETIHRHLAGYEGEAQDERRATYGCARVPADGQIDWSQSTGRIYALIRALGGPYPPAYTYLGTSRIAIARAAPAGDARPYVGRIPGRVVATSRREGHVDVLTGDGVIRIHEVIVEGSEPAPAASVIGSTRDTLGLQVEDLLARIATLEARLVDADLDEH